MEADTPAPAKKIRRRRYDAEFKRDLVEQTLQPGASVSRIAREHGINANQVFKWRRQQLLEDRPRGDRTPTSMSLIPVRLIDEPKGSSPEPSTDSGRIEIHLATGKIVVNGKVDSATLRVVLKSLRQ